jgi:hypothetical protein
MQPPTPRAVCGDGVVQVNRQVCVQPLQLVEHLSGTMGSFEPDYNEVCHDRLL